MIGGAQGINIMNSSTVGITVGGDRGLQGSLNKGGSKKKSSKPSTMTSHTGVTIKATNNNQVPNGHILNITDASSS